MMQMASCGRRIPPEMLMPCCRESSGGTSVIGDGDVSVGWVKYIKKNANP